MGTKHGAEEEAKRLKALREAAANEAASAMPPSAVDVLVLNGGEGYGHGDGVVHHDSMHATTQVKSPRLSLVFQCVEHAFRRRRMQHLSRSAFVASFSVLFFFIFPAVGSLVCLARRRRSMRRRRAAATALLKVGGVLMRSIAP